MTTISRSTDHRYKRSWPKDIRLREKFLPKHGLYAIWVLNISRHMRSRSWHQEKCSLIRKDLRDCMSLIILIRSTATPSSCKSTKKTWSKACIKRKSQTEKSLTWWISQSRIKLTINATSYSTPSTTEIDSPLWNTTLKECTFLKSLISIKSIRRELVIDIRLTGA